MWATVLGVHYIIVNAIWFLQNFISIHIQFIGMPIKGSSWVLALAVPPWPENAKT